MGVPKFFRYISERYPCLSELIREYQIPEFDNMYLDMNGIIHMCSHPDDNNPHFRITEEKIIKDIFHYIEVLFRMIRPQKLFFMAIDGVAPRAKMNQQRGRRFRSAKDAEKQEAEAKKKGETLPTEARFDSNCITPGTVFMARLHEQLKYFCTDKMSTDPLWRNIKIILSGHETPGEGEHKIMDYIRYLRSQPGYDPNTRHCLYGLDADLIMLGLCTHEPHFSLLREEVKFGRKSTKRQHVPEEITFFLLHLSLMREYLELEFTPVKDKLVGFEYDFEKIIDDWVLMGFLVGNDFIPHLPNLHIANGALPILYKAYMEVLPTLDGYINEGGTLNLTRFEKLMQKLAEIDLENFEDIRDDLTYMEAKTGRKATAHSKVSSGRELQEWSPDDDENDVQLESLEPEKDKPKRQDPALAALIQATDDLDIESDDEDDDDEDIAFRNYKKEYYMNKLEYAKVTPGVLRDQAEGYVRAIQWNLNYYYNGCCSWSWYYPHHYAPYISDIKGFADMKLEFDLGTPFKPYEQLLAVLPAASKSLLPEPYHHLMTSDESPLKDYYPVDFDTDLNGKKQEWEAVVLIPFMDEKRLLEAMKPCNEKLTEEEMRRNTCGPMLVYSYTSEDHGKYEAPAYFPPIKYNHSKLEKITIENLRVPKEKLVKGVYPGAQMNIFYPGFPTMKHLKYTAELKKAKVKVFEQASRNESMIITIIQDEEEESDDDDDVPVELLGENVFVGWPHMVEARVVAISTPKSRYVSVGDSNQYNMEDVKDKNLFSAECSGVIERYRNRLGIEVGEVKYLCHVQVMIGRKYVFTAHGRLTLEKQFSEMTAAYPAQTIVSNIEAYDSHHTLFRNIQDVFGEGEICFSLSQPYYGAQGIVTDSKETHRNGRVKVCVSVTDEPNFDRAKQIKDEILRSYRTLINAASPLGMSHFLFSRITGSIFVETPDGEGGFKNVNVGLDLKFNKKNKETPGYTRKIATTWYYTSKCVDLVREYSEKFPEVFIYFAEHGNNDDIKVENIFGNDWEGKLKELQVWLRSVPTYNMERQPCGSQVTEPEIVKEIEKIVDNFNCPSKKYTMSIKPAFLYKVCKHFSSYTDVQKIISIRQKMDELCRKRELTYTQRLNFFKEFVENDDVPFLYKQYRTGDDNLSEMEAVSTKSLGKTTNSNMEGKLSEKQHRVNENGPNNPKFYVKDLREILGNKKADEQTNSLEAKPRSRLKKPSRKQPCVDKNEPSNTKSKLAVKNSDVKDLREILDRKQADSKCQTIFSEAGDASNKNNMSVLSYTGSRSRINDRLLKIKLTSLPTSVSLHELGKGNSIFRSSSLLKLPKSNVQSRLLVSKVKNNISNAEALNQNPLDNIPALNHDKDINYNSKDSVSIDKIATISNAPIEINLENVREVKHVLEKYPSSKNTLHNFYKVLSTELKNKMLKIDPMYKSKKQTHGGLMWTCSYHIKWPINAIISARGFTKKEASHAAAAKVISVLIEHQKISSDGMPLIYSKEEVKKLRSTRETTLSLDNVTIESMRNIIQVFDEKIRPIVEGVGFKRYEQEVNDVFTEEPNSLNLFTSKGPKFLGTHRYLAREKVNLPISAFKESFINTINKNNCVIVKGEPGCGKSSRIPQYVLEAWISDTQSVDDDFCRIAVTQPRRIAAISLSERVSFERDEQVGHVVGYQVRLNSNFSTRTGRILYCTTGILLRHLQKDPNLSKFSHVILDEAHERDVNTDLLMNLLKRALRTNDKLKLVVMSATIDTKAFSDYFGGAPIFSVPGFTHPVKKYFLDDLEVECRKTLKMCNSENPQVVHDEVVEVIGNIHMKKPPGAILVFLPGWEDLSKIQRLIPQRSDVVVHMVHSKLKDSDQHKIFSKPPPGVRKIILATNIAETSITVDDVVYVVDTGIHKDNVFDIDKGINVLDMDWISKANANQRAGRAGRCSPGQSYHLYTREKYEKFADYTAPKILNTSLTKVVLDSKVFMNNMDATEFMDSLITPPERTAVERAVAELKDLELLDENEKLTPLGRVLVDFQLEPSLAKALVNGVVFKCTSPILDIVTLFSSETGIFGSMSLTDKDSIRTVKSQFSKSSDHLALMRVFEKWLEFAENGDRHSSERFCRDTNLVPYKLEFVRKLKTLHSGYLTNGLYGSMPHSDEFSDSDELVKSVLYSGTGTVLEHRNWDIVKKRLKLNSNTLVTRNNHKATITSESVNYKRSKYPSNFLVYINETRSNIRRTTIVRECSLIPAISVLLFNNNELEIIESEELKGEDSVRIGIKNTKLQFLCDRQQAEVLINCKIAIQQSYKYLIHQLTCAGEDIPDFLENWDRILQNLNVLLEKSKVE